MAAPQAAPGRPPLGADHPVRRELIIAADLAAAHEAGAAVIPDGPEITGGAIIADRAANMTAHMAAGPGELDRSRGRSLQGEVGGRRIRRGDERDERRAGKNFQHSKHPHGAMEMVTHKIHNSMLRERHISPESDAARFVTRRDAASAGRDDTDAELRGVAKTTAGHAHAARAPLNSNCRSNFPAAA